jgi:hypothetical protein
MKLHTYSDGSILRVMDASALIHIPIWKGNRHIDLDHVKNIKESTKAYLLDSGYKIIQYEEDGIKNSYLIDGQHRRFVVNDYFKTKTIEDEYFENPIKDFKVTVTEMTVDSEADAIDYFNRINNVKPIQYEEDPNLIINKYILGIDKAFPGMIKTKRPYLSSDKLRDALKTKINSLKKLSVDDFVNECKIQNTKMIQHIKTVHRKKDENIIKRMIELDFALGWDLKWIDSI